MATTDNGNSTRRTQSSDVEQKPRQRGSSSKPKDPKPIELMETGVDQDMVGASQVLSRTATDKRHSGVDFAKLREVPQNGFLAEDDRPTVQNLVSMRRMDGQARALYRLMTLPIRASLAGVTFVAREEEDGGEEESEFIRDALLTPQENGGMSVTFHRFIAQVLQGLFDGFAAFEKVFWSPDEGPLKGKWTLRKLAYRPADTVTFLADEHGGYAGFRQKSYNGQKQVDTIIPVPYSFYYAAQEEERKFYGVSYFESAFYHYDKKVRLYYAAHLAAQRSAVPTRSGKFGPSSTEAERNAFKAQLANLGMAQWIAMPDGFEVDVLNEKGGFDFLGYLNHHNSQMSKSILATFFDSDSGSGENEGSLVSFGSPGQEMFMLLLRAIQDEIATQINHYIIPQLIDFNFSSRKYPKMVWGNLTDDQKRAIARTFDKLAGNPQNLTPQFVRELEVHQAKEFGLEINYDEIPLADANYAGAFTPQIEQGLTNSPQGGAAISETGLGAENGLGGGDVDPLSAEYESALIAAKDQSVPLTAEDTASLVGFAMLKDDAIPLSDRQVATQAGEARYGKPIGSKITDEEAADPEGRDVTFERLRSLQRQYALALQYNNPLLLERVRKAFAQAMNSYTEGKSEDEVRQALADLKKNASDSDED